MGLISQIIFGLLKIFCGGDQKQHGNQQHGQQQGGWNQGQQQGGWNQNQQQYPPQGWNQGGQQGGWTGGAISSQHDYTQLRNQARHEGDLAHKCFADSQAAYKSGNGARAKELSNQGKAHQAKQDQMDEQAAAWIFQGELHFSGPEEQRENESARRGRGITPAWLGREHASDHRIVGGRARGRAACGVDTRCSCDRCCPPSERAHAS